MSFKMDSFFNPHLAAGNGRVDAIISVTSDSRTMENPALDFLFLIDTSGSMHQQDKLNHTKLALRQAFGLIPAHARFGVVAFNSSADVLIPLTKPTPEALTDAHHKVQRLIASGGTCMSEALAVAERCFSQAGDTSIKMALFLTDGENDYGDGKALEKRLLQCHGKFQCSARGVGTSWQPQQLRQIANALLGTADAICEGSAMEQDFKNTIAAASGKGIAKAALRLWTPKTAKITGIRQMTPEIVDLASMGKAFDDKNTDYPLGSWGSETRDYHITVEIPSGDLGDEVLACRPSLIFEENGVQQKIAGPNVVSTWSNDESLTTRINPQVAHYTGQAELASSIKEGLEAKSSGDIDRATRLLGKAVRIAGASGNEEVTRRLLKVVDVIDESMGTVKIKAGQNKAADMELDMGGTRTVRKRAVKQDVAKEAQGDAS